MSNLVEKLHASVQAMRAVHENGKKLAQEVEDAAKLRAEKARLSSEPSGYDHHGII